MPVAAMSIARCGASWAASTNSSAPCAWASCASCSSGHTSPVTLDAPVTASRSIPGSIRSASASSCSGDSGNGSRRRSCSRHGSMLAWCSTGVERTFVPGGSAWARTLIASVVLRTKTTVPSAAPTNRATLSRAFSYASVEIRDFAPVPRWTLLYHGTNASTASHTAAITGVLAA